MSVFIDELQQRGLIQQSTEPAALAALLTTAKIRLYCGFDPTADSLHVGHLLPVLTLKRFQEAGHTPIALVGGATGLIGDPSFKAAERALNTQDIVAAWSKRLQAQLEPFLTFTGDNAAILVNNADWTANLDVLTFLRDIGKHFSVNAMMNKEAVKQRLSRQDTGISFTEFAYSLLQAYDFSQLNKKYHCSLQIGGSDQWGNITAGIDLTRRLNRQTVYGLTLPLVTKADGTKFGKTEGGAVWLDPAKTSPYQFYQFWLQTPDADVYRYLKLFTFLSLADIAAIAEEDKNSGIAPGAQKILATAMTRLIHGKTALTAAERIARSLFADDQSELTAADFTQLALDGLPSFALPAERGLVTVLKLTGLAASNNEARGFIRQNAVRLNGQAVSDETYCLQDSDQRCGRYTVIQRGKRRHALLVWDKK